MARSSPELKPTDDKIKASTHHPCSRRVNTASLAKHQRCDLRVSMLCQTDCRNTSMSQGKIDQLSLLKDWFNLPDASLPRLSWKGGR